MLERGFSLSWLLITASLTQLGCAPANVQTGVLALCATRDASGFPEPHLLINSADQTIKAFDVSYHLDGCSNDEFVCLDGPIPFIQPLRSTDANDSDIDIGGNAEVHITAIEGGGSQFEIVKKTSLQIRKVTYSYGADSSLLNLEIVDTAEGQIETTRYEYCR